MVKVIEIHIIILLRRNALNRVKLGVVEVSIISQPSRQLLLACSFSFLLGYGSRIPLVVLRLRNHTLTALSKVKRKLNEHKIINVLSLLIYNLTALYRQFKSVYKITNDRVHHN